MKCLKCGEELQTGAKFCNKCGTSVDPKEKIKEQVSKFEKDSGINIISLIKGLFVDPTKTIEDNSKSLKNPKVAIISASVLVASALILNLLTTIIKSLSVRTCNIFGICKNTISLTRVFELNYFDLIFKQLAIFGILLFAFAGIYYIASLILNKKSDYFDMLSTVSCALVPYAVGTYLVAPIFGLLYGPLGMFITTFSKLYTIFILVFTFKDKLSLKSNRQIFLLNSICITAITIINYFIYL